MSGKNITREITALVAMHAIITTMNDWDLLSTGDFSPEEDTNPKKITDKAFQIADEFIKESKKNERKKRDNHKTSSKKRGD